MKPLKLTIGTFVCLVLAFWAIGCADPLALHKAAGRGDLDDIKSLVKDGYDVNAPDEKRFGWTPLIYAVMSGNLAVVKVLLEAGADVNGREANGQTALFSAIRDYEGYPDRLEILRALIDAGAEIDARSGAEWTPLMDAASGGNLKAMRILIARGADLNAQNKYGRTPVMVTIMNDEPEALQLLLAKGANRNLRDNYGKSACFFHDHGRTGGPCPLYR